MGRSKKGKSKSPKYGFSYSEFSGIPFAPLDCFEESYGNDSMNGCVLESVVTDPNPNVNESLICLKSNGLVLKHSDLASGGDVSESVTLSIVSGKSNSLESLSEGSFDSEDNDEDSPCIDVNFGAFKDKGKCIVSGSPSMFRGEAPLCGNHVGPSLEQFPLLAHSSKKSCNLKISNYPSSVLSKADFVGTCPASQTILLCENSSGGDSSTPKSWSSLFVKGRVSSISSGLQYFKPFNSNGQISVKPPAEVAAQGCECWDSSLVGHFVDNKLPFSIVKYWANKLWNKDASLEVFSAGNGFYVFKFSDSSYCDEILDGGPWFFAGKLLMLRKWQPGLAFTKEKLSSVPVWIKFFNVPLEFWTCKGLSYVASAIGIPLYLDAITASRQRIDFARICVEISADDNIPESFDLVLSNGDSVVMKVETVWKPKKCELCKIFGHSSKDCLKSSKKVWAPILNSDTQKVALPNVLNSNSSHTIVTQEVIQQEMCLKEATVRVEGTDSEAWTTVVKKNLSGKSSCATSLSSSLSASGKVQVTCATTAKVTTTDKVHDSHNFFCYERAKPKNKAYW